ncbi:putative proline-rich receptor-like protein kinase PERK3 [Iris pallida]|uniref:Proline-rich receptor-like protein kinase PERK3 n=1 Tax=Iris pallida TaxID=29817 RepID=A0AAX6FC32_IRIPA|nr:putative proline-rich receptor-like protein kinase PERK3 [Iris pallida]
MWGLGSRWCYERGVGRRGRSLTATRPQPGTEEDEVAESYQGLRSAQEGRGTAASLATVLGQNEWVADLEETPRAGGGVVVQGGGDGSSKFEGDGSGVSDGHGGVRGGRGSGGVCEFAFGEFF